MKSNEMKQLSFSWFPGGGDIQRTGTKFYAGIM